jgi:hypothetical protein
MQRCSIDSSSPRSGPWRRRSRAVAQRTRAACGPCAAERKAHVARRALERRGRISQLGISRACIAAATRTSRASSSTARWTALAEEKAREVGQVVRLVEDERVRRAEELRRALVASAPGRRRRGGGSRRPPPRRPRACAPSPRSNRRNACRPSPGSSRGSRSPGSRREVSGTSPHSERSPVIVVFAKRRMRCRCTVSSREANVPCSAATSRMMHAKIVGAALRSATSTGHAERLAHHRQVRGGKLVLERLGAGGHG